MKTLSFSHVRFADLQKIVNIEQRPDQQVFDEWFQYPYAIGAEEHAFLQELIEKNWRYVMSYSEEELKIKFIGPLLNRVQYQVGNIRDWYQRPLKAKNQDVTLNGYTDNVEVGLIY